MRENSRLDVRLPLIDSDVTFGILVVRLLDVTREIPVLDVLVHGKVEDAAPHITEEKKFKQITIAAGDK